MGFTKNKGLSVVIGLIVLVVFSIIAFVLPVNHSILFWMGYSFTVFAALFLFAVTLITLNKPSLNDKFHGLPALNLAWIYFVLQLALSLWQMISFDYPYFAAIIADTVLAAVFVIFMILTYAAENEITRVEEKVAEKVFYIKSLQTDIELLESSDLKLTQKLKALAEDVRFSDPMSHSKLAPIENTINHKFDLLKQSITDIHTADSLIDEIQKLLAERNKKCKLLKGVPEPKPESDNSGIKIAAVAFGAVGAFVILLLVICFVAVPNSKYNDALALLNSKQYAEAIIAFENLGSYKDSAYRIETAKEALKEEKYAIAEECYKNQQYMEAVKIFAELGDYKDSKDKIEHIYNMSASGDKIYFGSYDGEPIPWRALKTDEDKMLLITENTVGNLAFNDELKNITWESSSIRKWLNNDFLKGFSDDQKSRIIKTADDIFLLSQEQYNQYSVAVPHTKVDWWLSTKTDAGMMYVNGETGEVNTTGEGVVHALGIRPCVWVSLR